MEYRRKCSLSIRFYIYADKLAINDLGAKAELRRTGKCETDLQCSNPIEGSQSDCGLAFHL
jgi:hypothetical protein